jgi:hypothetical protein
MHCILSISQNLQTKMRLKTFALHLTDVTQRGYNLYKNGPCKSVEKIATCLYWQWWWPSSAAVSNLFIFIVSERKMGPTSVAAQTAHHTPRWQRPVTLSISVAVQLNHASSTKQNGDWLPAALLTASQQQFTKEYNLYAIFMGFISYINFEIKCPLHYSVLHIHEHNLILLRAAYEIETVLKNCLHVNKPLVSII